jgi:valyl-tRNA synthetase
VEIAKQVITQIRNIRNNKQISPKEALSLSVKANSSINYQQYELMIKKLANLSQFDRTAYKVNGATSFLVATDEFFVPFAENIDPQAEAERLQKEKEYLIGFLKSVNAKLLNERFMANAKPEIIEVEQRKKADAEAKLKIIQDRLDGLAT